jgi:glycosyltransferase involved in cell wall biosynthesis
MIGLVNDYTSNVGGVERHILDLASGLHAKGNIICTYATHIDASDIIPGSTLRLDPVLPPSILKLTGFDPRVHSQFRRVLQQHRPEALVMFDMYRMSLSPITVADELQIPTVLSIHNYYPVCFKDTMFTRGDRCDGPGPMECGRCLGDGFRSKTGAFLPGRWGDALYLLASQHMSRILRSVKAVAVPSTSLKQRLSDSMPYLEPRIEVIPNGIKVEDYDPKIETSSVSRYPTGAKNLLYFGRLTEEKGVQVLLNALKFLGSRGEVLRCFVVGEGPYRESLERLTQASHLDEIALFTGRVGRRTLLEFLALADVVVLPSLWDEPFPYACLEAMAMSKPVVASNVGGFPEIITEGKNGFLVEPADDQAIAERLAYLLDNDGIRERVGLRARETVLRNFPIEMMVNRYSDLLQRAVHA